MKDPDLVIDDASDCDALFKPHGQFAVKVDGDVVLVEASGPFNRELSERYVVGVGPLFARASAKGPYGVLIVFEQSMLMGPDAIQVFADFLFTAKQKHGVRTVGTACVAAADVEAREFMLPLLEQKVYAPAGVTFRAFARRDEAQEWLRQRIRDAGSA